MINCSVAKMHTNFVHAFEINISMYTGCFIEIKLEIEPNKNYEIVKKSINLKSFIQVLTCTGAPNSAKFRGGGGCSTTIKL